MCHALDRSELTRIDQFAALTCLAMVLDPDHLRVLLDLMTKTTTGERRIKGNLPTGTPVAAKTGRDGQPPTTSG